MAEYSDVNATFDDDSNNTIVLKDLSALAESVENIISTEPSDRFFLPEFHARWKDLLFEPLSEDIAREIVLEMRDDIIKWDDRVLVDLANTSVRLNRAQYLYEVSLSIVDRATGRSIQLDKHLRAQQ